MNNIGYGTVRGISTQYDKDYLLMLGFGIDLLSHIINNFNLESVKRINHLKIVKH
jgi:hypothetical protein